MAREPKRNAQANEIDCLRAAELLVDYLTGELEPAITQQLDAHLKGCEDCVAFFDTYEKIIQTAQSLSFKAIPPEMQNRVLNFLKKKRNNYDNGLGSVLVQRIFGLPSL